MNSYGLKIAVPRGALFGETLDLLAGIGIDVTAVRENDRRLYFGELGLVTMRPSDVVTYVSAGVADLGIVGKDVLMERADGDVYELLDLGCGGCRMVVAAVEGSTAMEDRLRTLGYFRVATKYPELTKRYFASNGCKVKVIEVKGSVELAAISGLAEAIVDLTATGATLAENGLVEREEIALSTARLVANPVSYRIKAAEVNRLLAGISDELANRGSDE